MLLPVLRWGLGGALALCLLLCGGPLALAQPAVGGADGARPGPAFLVAIDRSGSMLAREGSRRRSEVMLERALAFLDSVPDGSHLWVALFDSKVDIRTFEVTGAQDRAAVGAYLRGAYRITRGAQTALFDTLAQALEHAESLAAASPGRSLSLLVYSDGEDTVSSGWASCGADPSVESCSVGREPPRRSLCHRLHGLVRAQRQTQVFVTRIAGAPAVLDPACAVAEPGRPSRLMDSEPQIPVLVGVEPAEVVLAHPAESPTASVPLRFTAPAGDPGGTLSGGVGLRFVASSPSLEGRVRVTPSSAPLPGGRSEQVVSLEVTDPGSLPADTPLSGHLELDWGTSKTHVVLAPKSVPVVFQRRGLSLSGVLPSEGNRVFAVEQPVQFFVETLSEATVTWRAQPADAEPGTPPDFERAGASVTHAFGTPGVRTVEVVARWRGLEARESFTVQVVDVRLALSGPTQVFAGRPARFAVEGEAGFRSFSWESDGRSFPGSGPRGSSHEHVFEREGSATLSVRGTHTRLAPVRASLAVEVLPAPSVVIRVVDPADGVANKTSVTLGQPVTLEARVSGPVQRVGWRLLGWKPGAVEGIPLEPLDAVPVVEGRAERSHVFPVSAGLRAVEVVAVGHLPESVGFGVESEPVRFSLVEGARSLQVVAPLHGASFVMGEAITAEAAVQGAAVARVRWRLVAEGKTRMEETVAVAEGRARLALTLPELSADAPAELTAEGVLAEGVPAEGSGGPKDTVTLGLRFPEVAATVEVEGEGRWNQPVQFKLACASNCETVRWDFGDGQTDASGARVVSHTFEGYGSFLVLAEITGRGGKTGEARADFTVRRSPPRAGLEVRAGGEVAARVPVGTPVELVDVSTGDVAERRLLVDDAPLPADARSVVLDAEGPRTVTLVVTGPDGVEDRVTVTVVAYRYDWLLFLLVVGGVLGVLFVVGRVFTGNHAAAFALFAHLEADKVSSADARRTAWLKGRRLRWRRGQWARPKSLRLSVAELVPASDAYAHWREGRGAELCLLVGGAVGAGTLRLDKGTLGSGVADVRLENEGLERTRVWSLVDTRGVPRGTPPPRLYLYLNDTPRKRPATDRMVLVVAALLGALAIWAAWRQVFLQ